MKSLRDLFIVGVSKGQVTWTLKAAEIGQLDVFLSKMHWIYFTLDDWKIDSENVNSKNNTTHPKDKKQSLPLFREGNGA